MAKHKKPAQLVILASAYPDVPKNKEVATHVCQDCNTEFSVTASLTPYCVKCGSEETTIVRGSKKVTAGYSKTDVLSSVQCECGTYTILPDSVAAELAGSICCVACGDNINYGLEAEEDDAYNQDDEYQETSHSDQVELDLFEDTDTEESNLGEDELELEEPEELEENSEFEESVELEDEFEEADADLDEEDEIYIEDENAVEASLVDIAVGKAEWVRTPNKILAFVGDLCVASLPKSDSIPSHAAFDRPPFLEAIESYYQANGLKKTLREFSFKPNKIRLEHSSVLEEKIDEVIEQNKADVEEAVASWVSTFKQSLGIAASGLNKNFFQNKRHALKASLFDEMLAAGVKNPASIIDRVFASESDEHHRTLLALADEISAKPLDVRNSLASAIGESNYMLADSDEDESEDEDQYVEMVESSLANPMKSAVEPKAKKIRLFNNY